MLWLALALMFSATSVAAFAALDRRRWKVWPARAQFMGRKGYSVAGLLLAISAAISTAAIPLPDWWMSGIAFASQYTLAAVLYGLVAGFDPQRAHRMAAVCAILAVALLAWLLVIHPIIRP
jgi:hypothetical protein